MDLCFGCTYFYCCAGLDGFENARLYETNYSDCTRKSLAYELSDI